MERSTLFSEPCLFINEPGILLMIIISKVKTSLHNLIDNSSFLTLK